MSVGTERVPILPRRVASAVTVAAVSQGARAIAAVMIIIAIPGLVGLYQREGYTADLAPPVVSLAVMLGALALTVFRPSPLTLATYIAVGAASTYFFLYAVLGAHPDLLPVALILVNRPTAALVLVGTSGSRPLVGVAWGLAGFVAGLGVTALVAVQLGLPLALGNGPALTLANYSAAYLGLSLIQRAQRRRIPDFLLIRAESRRLDAARDLDQRAVAVLHDTVLNDLALIINGPDSLDSRTRDQMLADVATLADADVLEERDKVVFVSSGDASLRNEMMALVTDFQWRGLTVEVTGDTGRVVHIEPDVIAAATGALRACLQNVLSHSGTDSAEVIVAATDSTISWTVSDAGVGFDPSEIRDDRLGLRTSLFRRVEAAGGTVRVWSAIGNGTSIIITLPILPAPAQDSHAR